MNSVYLLLDFLGLLVESVDYVQQCELRCDVGPCFHSALCINGAPHIAEVAQKVEGIEHADEVSVHEAFGARGVFLFCWSSHTLHTNKST